jgi:hypothetical protein
MENNDMRYKKVEHYVDFYTAEKVVKKIAERKYAPKTFINRKKGGKTLFPFSILIIPYF